MKLLKVCNAVTLVLASSLVLVKGENKSLPGYLDDESFREPKNVAFSAMMGGSSHIVWVLTILNELSNRGHKTHFITRDDHTRFAAPFPSVNAVSVGKPFEIIGDREIMESLRERPVMDSSLELTSALYGEFSSDYVALLDYFTANKIDTAVCDHFNSACHEAATTLKIPFVITSTLAVGPDASAPYINNGMIDFHRPSTIDMSITERIYDKFVGPALFKFKSREFTRTHEATKRALGLTSTGPPEAIWENSLKIINNAFGFENARPLGPLFHFVGPIIPDTVPAVLTSALEGYFKTHHRVAYIAFGQHAVATRHDLKLILTGLLEAYEQQDIDGIIWATRGIENVFPSYLTTRSNITYDVQSFAEGTSEDVFFLKWAPQVSILGHPSTSMFITHGGAGSLYESMNAGVRVIVYPFFGDQPAAAITAEKNGIGLKLDYKGSQKAANKVIRRVARDDDQYFSSNVKRFQALVQLNKKLGVQRSASLIEEAMFTHQDGQLLHRRDVKRDMSFMKANNLDIYAIVISFAALNVYLVYLLSRLVLDFLLGAKAKTKKD